MLHEHKEYKSKKHCWKNKILYQVENLPGGHETGSGLRTDARE